MKLLATDQYYDELLEQLPKARRRIVMAAMIVAAGPKMDRLFSAAEAALERGVSVHILTDIYTKTIFARSRRPHQQVVRETKAIFDRLEAKGARISWIGQRNLNPFKGRCHVKAVIVDDQVYSFGGINLSDESYEAIDYMLGTTDAILAHRIAGVIDQLASRQIGTADLSWRLDDQNTALVDVGVPGQSIIFDRACQLAANAKSIIYVSQMGPSGKLAKALNQTEMHYFYNHPSQMGFPSNFGALADQLRYRTKSQYRHGQKPPYIHAKFILFELKDGTKALMSGSNNFSYRGVRYGTQEIALESTDSKLWQLFYDFWQDKIQ